MGSVFRSIQLRCSLRDGLPRGGGSTLDLIYATIFLALSALEFGRSVMNSFVLLVISATFLKGFFKRKDSYGFVASIMAIAFAFLSTLLLLEGTFCYGLFGYVAIPAFFRHRKGILNRHSSSKHGRR